MTLPLSPLYHSYTCAPSLYHWSAVGFFMSQRMSDSLLFPIGTQQINPYHKSCPSFWCQGKMLMSVSPGMFVSYPFFKTQFQHPPALWLPGAPQNSICQSEGVISGSFPSTHPSCTSSPTTTLTCRQRAVLQTTAPLCPPLPP
jgi:hypothetical protein